MKKLFYFVAILLFTACSNSTTNNEENESTEVQHALIEKELSIIPLPLHSKVYDAELKLSGISITTEGEQMANEEMAKAMLEPYQLGEENPTKLHLNANAGIDSLGQEGYLLRIGDNGIEIAANQASGVFYGLQSLIQLFPTPGEEVVLPYAELVDIPTLKWRGLHLDVCRHFYPVEFVKKFIDQMAKYKLNTFHWHLTEDQGWRIEIKKYPLLTEIGSKRKETILEKNFNPYIGDGVPYEGFYTQEEIKEVVAYAAERHVTIVPEIEMPGHSVAALTAYPQFSCTGGPFEVRTKWGVSYDTYCTTDETFEFLTDILDEVIELFPSHYIHIGGDEAPKDRWKECDKCQKRMQEEGLATEEELQSYFIKRIEKHLISKGRALIGWDEILEGGLAPEATVMSWRGETGGFEASEQGHDVVMTPGFAMYFDHYQGDREQEPLAICCFTPLKKVYDYMPVSDQLEEEQKKHIIGVQANVWTEYIPDEAQVEYMVYPRAIALSEIAWTPNHKKDWDSFLTRLEGHFPRMDQDEVNYRIPEPFGLEDKLISGGGMYQVELRNPVPNSTVYYTTDGTTPGVESQEYTGPIELNFDEAEEYQVQAVTILANGESSIIAKANYKGMATAGVNKELKQGIHAHITDGHFATLDELEVEEHFQNDVVQGHFRIPGIIGWYSSFGLKYEGFIEISEAGSYQFNHIAEGGNARLYINDQLLVENGGEATVQLEAGLVPVKVLFFNTDSKYKLDLQYAKEGGELKRVEKAKMWN